MDKEYIKDIIERKVIPKLNDDFLESESAFFLYIEYDEHKGVCTTVVPAPDMENVEEVMRDTARVIAKEMHALPTLLIGCERIKYRETDDMEEADLNVDTMDSGMVIVAFDASNATGVSYLYKMPDIEYVTEKEFTDGEDAPPYTTLAVSVFMKETITALREDRDFGKHKPTKGHAHAEFKFSRN